MTRQYNTDPQKYVHKCPECGRTPSLATMGTCEKCLSIVRLANEEERVYRSTCVHQPFIEKQVNWEKEFEERFRRKRHMVTIRDGEILHPIEELTNFIQNTLQAHTQHLKAQLLEGLPKLKEHICRFNDGECECDCFKESLHATKEIIEKVLSDKK